MNFRRLKHILLRLSAEEKVMAAGCFAVLASLFFPWHSMVLNFEKTVISTGFSGDLGVLGFVVFLFNLSALGFLLAGHLRFRLPQLGFRKEQIILFFVGESAFLLLLAFAIYTKRSLEYTNAEIRFGLYISLIATFLGTFAAFSEIQKTKKKETQEFFEHPDEDVSEPSLFSPPVRHAHPAPHERHQELPRHGHPNAAVEPETPEQEKFFYQAKAPFKELDETLKEETETPASPDSFAEEESVAEEIAPEASAPTEISIVSKVVEVRPSSPVIKEETSSPPEISTDEILKPQKAMNADMGFYKDL